MFNKSNPLYQGGAKPKRNEQITIKEQLKYEGPFLDYSINVKIESRTVKVVFESKTKDSSKDSSKEKSSKKESSKQTSSSKQSDSKQTSSEPKNENTNENTADNSVENPFGDIQQPIEEDIFGQAVGTNQSQAQIQSSSQTKISQAEISLETGFPTYNFDKAANVVKVNWYMSDRFDHQLFEIFVKFFFGFEIQTVKSKFKEYILDGNDPIEPIYRKNLYQRFEYYQNIFKLYSFESSVSNKTASTKSSSKTSASNKPDQKQILTPVYQIDVYEIENKIFDYKDLFNNIQLTDNIICVQFETNVKCPIYWSLKTLTIYPNFGQNTFSIVYKQNGVVQIQILQGKYLYVFSLTSDLNFENEKRIKAQSIINIVPLQIEVKKYIKSYFEIQQQLQYEHSQFMMNFSDHFEIQKLSNTNYKIDFLSNIVVSIYTRYSTLFFSTISDDIDLVKMYFRICQNCGNFEQVYPISDLNTLQVISPLEFGNTQISNFEHQLESMKKRPTIIFDPTLKDVLADENIFVMERRQEKEQDEKEGDQKEQEDEKDGQKENPQKDAPKENQTQDDSFITNELKRQIVNIQNSMSLNGYSIDGFKFYCNKNYPYLNFTKFDIEFQEDEQIYPLYYYKCQQIPIKASIQNIYKLYDVYRHFHLNDAFEKFLYREIQGLIQQKPNLFLKYETIIPGQYTILPQNLYKIFPNTTFLLKLIMKNDEKTTLNEYRKENADDESDSDNKSNSKDKSSSNNTTNNDAPWDNNWLSSVTNGQTIEPSNAVFYDIPSNQYFVYRYQPQYDYIVLIYQQQFFTLIEYSQSGSQIQLGRGRSNKSGSSKSGSDKDSSQKQTQSQPQSQTQSQKYKLHNIAFEFDKEINKFVEGYDFNDEYIQTKYLQKDVIISRDSNIYQIIPPKQKITEPYTQKSSYDQTYIINQDKNIIGYKQYNKYVYYKQPEKIDYNKTYVLGNVPIIKSDASNDVFNNDNAKVNLSTSEIASIIIFNNKNILQEELPNISKKDFNTQTINKLFSKLYLNIGKQQDIKFYNTKINYLTTVITEKQAKEGIEYIIKIKPDSKNLLQSFIVNYTFEDHLYYDSRYETIKQLSAYVQLQNVLHYRDVIQK